MMSNEEGQCFHCQELGHIAHHCPNIRCFEYDEHGHIATDCPDRIPPSGTPAHHERHHFKQDITLNPLLDIITGTGTGITGPDHSHPPTDITVLVKITHTTGTPGHITDTLTEAPHITVTLALIIITVTHPTGDHHHVEAHPLTPEITTDPEHIPIQTK